MENGPRYRQQRSGLSSTAANVQEDLVFARRVFDASLFATDFLPRPNEVPMTKRIAHQPREIAECVSAFLQEGDLAGITSMFHPDCRIYFPPDEPPLTGLAGAQTAFEDFLDMRPEIRSEVFSEIVCGDVALLRANWSVVSPDGTILAEGKSTEVAKKLENGGWGYLIDCPNGPPSLA